MRHALPAEIPLMSINEATARIRFAGRNSRLDLEEFLPLQKLCVHGVASVGMMSNTGRQALNE
jgi:hypothetical protein